MVILYCLTRPFLWNFNLSFQSIERPHLLLRPSFLNTTSFLVIGTVAGKLFGAHGILAVLVLSHFVTLLFQTIVSQDQIPFRTDSSLQLNRTT